MFKKLKEMSTSKKLITYIFVNCTVIEIFVMIIMLISVLQTPMTMTATDFSPLTALIGAVVGEVIGYSIYSLKAMKENTNGGITYMLAEEEEKKKAFETYLKKDEVEDVEANG